MYTTISMQCIDKTLTPTNLPKITSGGREEVRVEFAFDPSWSKAGKVAVFYRTEELTHHAVLVDDACTVPWYVLQQPGKLYIGVYGAEGETIRTTEVLPLLVEQGAVAAASAMEPTPDVYQQLLAAYGATNASLKAEIAVERARVNNLAKLPEGSTAGDAELQDIRVDWAGQTHANAGDAVRAQAQAFAEGTGLVGVYEWHLTANAAKLVENIVPGGAYIFEVPKVPGLSTVTLYLDDAAGNSTTYRGYQPGDTIEITVPEGVARLKFWVTVTGACTFKLLQYAVQEYNMDARLRALSDRADALESFYPPYDCIIGATTGRIYLDTNAKTATVQGLFFFENGNWRNLTTALTLSLDAYTPNSLGETVRLVLNASGELIVRNIAADCNAGDINLCLIMITGSWHFDAGKVYANAATRSVLYVDGAVLQPDVKELSREVKSLSSGSIGKNTCKIFKRVCCCGDSFTSGHIADASGTARPTNEEYAWPHYMATETGNEWINCGQSGANVLTWQTSSRGLPKAKAAGKVQAYVIGLMINDRSSGTDRYVDLGTVHDIGTNAETYYGGMSKIIRELNAISPEAKIFVLTCPQTGDLYPAYNQAVRDIVEAYEGSYPVHCLDLLAYADRYAAPSLTGDAWYGHYTAIGYEQFAEIFSGILSEYINANIPAFRDVPFIEYDE